jgi:DNA-binding transcriptional MerR regulator
MALSDAADQSVVEFLTIAALERYQATWDQLIQHWFDRECCRRANLELEEIRKLVLALPQVSADLMEVTMRHAQLLRALLKRERVEPGEAEVAALRSKHRAAIQAIRSKCVHCLATQQR